MKRAKKKRDNWVAGYACACAVMAKVDGFVGSGSELAKEGGFNLKNFEEALVEPCDLEDLKKDGLRYTKPERK